MNIGKAARLSSLSSKTIRYYEDIGLVVPRRQEANAYRDYSETDVRHLVFLQRARTFGLGLDECRLLLNVYRSPDLQDETAIPLVREKLAQLDDHLRVLSGLRETLAQMLDRYRGQSFFAVDDTIAQESVAREARAQQESQPPKAVGIMPFTLMNESPE